VPQPLTDLMAWLSTNSDREGRILIEDSEYDSGHQFYGAHFPALFPEYVKREYLCGPRPMYPVKHSYASFTAGVLFEREIADYSLEELQQMFDLYNVKWIVCWSKTTKDFFDQHPDYLTLAGTVDRFSIYQVSREPSCFLKGSGKVKADYNRLELSQIHAEDNAIIISYHWMKQLRTEPERRLERVFLGGDPIGFIRILDPPSTLVVYNSYRYPGKLID